MKCNDLCTLWTVLKNLRDATTDYMLIAVIEIAMVALTIEREARLEDLEPGADKEP